MSRVPTGSVSFDNPIAAKKSGADVSVCVTSRAAVAPGELSKQDPAPDDTSSRSLRSESTNGDTMIPVKKRSSSRGQRRSQKIVNSYGSGSARSMRSVSCADDADGASPDDGDFADPPNQTDSAAVRGVSMSEAKMIDARSRRRDRLNIAATATTMVLVVLLMLFHFPPILDAVQKSVPAWKEMANFDVRRFFGIQIWEVVLIWLIGGVSLALSAARLHLLCGGRAEHIHRVVRRHWDSLDSALQLKLQKIQEKSGNAVPQDLQKLEVQAGSFAIASKRRPSTKPPGNLPQNDAKGATLQKSGCRKKYQSYRERIIRTKDLFSPTGDYFFEKECASTIGIIFMQGFNLEYFGQSGVSEPALVVFTVMILLRSLQPLILLRSRVEHIFLMHMYFMVKFIFVIFFSFFALVHAFVVIGSGNHGEISIEEKAVVQRQFTARSIPALQNAFMTGGGDVWEALIKIFGRFFTLCAMSWYELRDLDQLNIVTTVAELEKIKIDFHLRPDRRRVGMMCFIIATGAVCFAIFLIGITHAACDFGDWPRICIVPASALTVGVRQAFSPRSNEDRSCPCSILRLVNEPPSAMTDFGKQRRARRGLTEANRTGLLPRVFDKHATFLKAVIAENSTVPVLTCIPDKVIILSLLDVGLSKIDCKTPRKGRRGAGMLNLEIWRNPDLEDISDLEYLKELKILSIRETSVSSIRAVQHMKEMSVMSLITSKVKDISPLATLTTLINLHLHQNFVSDIGPLQGLTNLIELGMFRNPVVDLSPIRNLKKIRALMVGPDVTSIDALRELQQLSELDLSFNTKLRSVDGLRGLDNLETLNLQFTAVDDISPITRDELANKLKHLVVANSSLTGTLPSALASLTALQDLDLGNTFVTDIPPLTGLKSLSAGISFDGNSFFCPANDSPDRVIGGLPLCKGTRTDAVSSAGGVLDACRNCTARCFPSCPSNFQGDGIGDYYCNTQQCDYDGGDNAATMKGKYQFDAVASYGPLVPLPR